MPQPATAAVSAMRNGTSARAVAYPLRRPEVGAVADGLKVPAKASRTRLWHLLGWHEGPVTPGTAALAAAGMASASDASTARRLEVSSEADITGEAVRVCLSDAAGATKAEHEAHSASTRDRT